jgi:ABC-type glycerol-3-phosphate transport system substrate-binding protein
MRRRRLLAAAAGGVGAGLGIALPGSARARPAALPGCPAAGLTALGGLGEIQLIGNSFPAVAHIARRAEACARPGLKVSFKLTPQARVETEQAFASASRSPFDAAVVSMGVFSNLYARRQLAPLTDLVRRHGARWGLEERMLVRMDGEVMAIAFMQNTQCLYYRADLFDKHRLAVPTTYAEMVAAARVLARDEPDIVHPIAQGFAKGFDSATEFTNVLASLGGRYFEASSFAPAFHREAGVQAVAAMRSLLPYMTPNALASNSDDVVNQFQQGRAAMGVLWATRAARMDDPQASRVVGRMQFAAAPAARAGGSTAAHLWWDGIVMPRNALRSPQAAARMEAAFEVLMNGLSAEAVAAGNDLAIWVRSNYRPGRFGTGVALAQAAGARVWPGEPFFSLAHGEVGKVLPEALSGQRAPADALAAAAEAYARIAAEKGFARAAAPAGARA